MQTTICPWKPLCGGTCTGLASSGCTSADPKAPKPFVLAELWPAYPQMATTALSSQPMRGSKSLDSSPPYRY